MIKGVKVGEKAMKGSGRSIERLSLLFLIIFISHFTLLNKASAQEHSPDVALRWSILPGAGQVYNHQAWKVPIIYGAFAGVGYFIYDNYKAMRLFKDEYLYRVNNNDQPLNEDYAAYPTSNISELYNSYNHSFQLMVVIAVGVYGLNLLDAYVFGHLFDFTIDDDISLNFTPSIQPTPTGWYPTIGASLSF